MIKEAEGCSILARVFESRGYRIARDVGLELGDIEFTADGWDAGAKVGFEYMTREAEKLKREDVRVRFLGRREGLAPDIVDMMENLEAETADRTRFGLNVALNHGGRDEISRAMQRIARKVSDGALQPDAITEAVLHAHLDSAGLPDPCLIVRTSGEFRISNFLLWQAAYAEYEFLDTLWPDFTADMLSEIVSRFGQRERRFGAVVG